MTIRRTVTALLAVAALIAMPLSVQAGSIEPQLLHAAQISAQTDFLILLSDKADLKAATAGAKTKLEKGQATVVALKAAAARSQPGVLAALQARGLEHRAFWIANAITARGSLADIQALAARADVSGLYKIDAQLNLLSPYIARRADAVRAVNHQAKTDYVAKALGDNVEAGVALVRAPAVWQLGFKGQGVVVGDHDIGVMWDHPALKNNYRGWDGTTASHAYNWRNAFGAADLFCTDPEVPCDSNGHGTHTTGTMVGFDGGDNQIGMAPEAQWMACRSLLDPVLGVGTVPTYMDCMEWQIAPYPEGDPDAADPAMAPDVANNSWGCLEACAPPLLKDVNDAIYEAGIVQVVSAGNDGDTCSTVAFPIAVYESSFTVGASDVADEMAGFSSRGPVLTDGSMRLKPNITAPGVDTRSAWNDGDYNVISGTSMAGPHVAGLVALLMSAEPKLKGRVADVRKLIELSAVQTITTVQTCGGTAVSDIPNNISGWGRIDALNAVTMRPQLQIATAAPASASAGESFTYTATVTQPATGKIDATTVDLLITLPPEVVVVSSSEPRTADVVTIEGVLAFQRPVLKPGEQWVVSVVLQPSAASEVIAAASAEADQVSRVDGAATKTILGAGATAAPTTPTIGSFGRVGGGAFGLASLLLLGLGAALGRRR